jgi:hypothetical protein
MGKPAYLLKKLHNPRGIKISELKDWISTWPDIDIWGDDAEVWIDSAGGGSRVLTTIWPLNIRTDHDGVDRGDILIEVLDND